MDTILSNLGETPVGDLPSGKLKHENEYSEKEDTVLFATLYLAYMHESDSECNVS